MKRFILQAIVIVVCNYVIYARAAIPLVQHWRYADLKIFLPAQPLIIITPDALISPVDHTIMDETLRDFLTAATAAKASVICMTQQSGRQLEDLRLQLIAAGLGPRLFYKNFMLDDALAAFDKSLCIDEGIISLPDIDPVRVMEAFIFNCPIDLDIICVSASREFLETVYKKMKRFLGVSILLRYLPPTS